MTTDVSTFASSEFTMRYKQPYVTEGLNKKFFAVLPRGIYRGFRLGIDPGAGDRTVSVLADVTVGDHVAVYQSAAGFSLSLRKTIGDFLIPLTSYASQTVYVTIYASYSVGATTAAFIRIYTEAEFAASVDKDDLVVLGKVDVPAAGNPITSSMIGSDERDMAWENRAIESIPWSQVFFNTNFALADTASTGSYSAVHWLTTVASGTWGPSASDPYSGTKCMLYTYAGGTETASLVQQCYIPVVSGQRIRVRVSKKLIQSQTAVAGSIVIRPTYMRDTGALYDGPDIALSETAEVSYSTVDKTFEVPSLSPPIVHLAYVALRLVGCTFGATGAALRVGEFEVWVENMDPEKTEEAAQAKHDALTMSLSFWADNLFSSIVDRPKLRTAISSNKSLGLYRADEKSGSGINQPQLDIPGSISLGSGYVNSAAQAGTARVFAQHAPGATSKYTLIWEQKCSSGTNSLVIRLYAAAGVSNYSGGFYFTVNAYYSGGQWERDNSGDAWMMVISREDGSTSIEVYEPFGIYLHLSTDSSTWADTSADATWRAVFEVLPTEEVRIPRDSLVLGSLALATIAQTALPRVSTMRSDTTVDPYGRVLVWELPKYTGSVGHAVRVYRGFDGSGLESLMIASNCYWDGNSGGRWNCEYAAAGSASLLSIHRSGWTMFYKTSSLGSPWADAGWSSYDHLNYSPGSGLRLDNKIIDLVNSSTATNPVYIAAAGPNKIYHSSIVKGWGYLKMDGAGGFTTIEGLNVGTPSFSVGAINITFPVAMANNDVAVVASWNDQQRLSNNGFLCVRGVTSSGFQLFWVGALNPVGPGGTLDVADMVVSWIVCAKQTS